MVDPKWCDGPCLDDSGAFANFDLTFPDTCGLPLRIRFGVEASRLDFKSFCTHQDGVILSLI